MSTSLDDLRPHVEKLRWARERIAELKEIEAGARAAIEERLGDDEAGTLDGETVVLWRSHKRAALDQKYLKRTFPQVAAECMVTSVVRRFEVL